MTKLSLLDLVPVCEGGTVSDALARSADLAAHAEALRYERFWVAEHHGMRAIASAATSVVLAHVGAATRSIRIGSGGIMLPNHAPLAIAEQFGTLDALFPGRVDLGLGRAPGSDQRVSNALRRDLMSRAEHFPQDVMELQAYFSGDPRIGFHATPGAGANVEIWILGSSLYGAQVAAALGLPFGFASHFAPDMLDEALAIYRRNFRPSAQLDQPYAMAGFSIFAADTRDEAEYIATSMMQSVIARRTGDHGPLPPPRRGYRETLPPQGEAIIAQFLGASSIGAKDDVVRDLSAFVKRTGVDEVIVAGMVFDHEARKRSFAIAAEAAREIDADAAVA